MASTSRGKFGCAGCFASSSISTTDGLTVIDPGVTRFAFAEHTVYYSTGIKSEPIRCFGQLAAILTQLFASAAFNLNTTLAPGQPVLTPF